MGAAPVPTPAWTEIVDGTEVCKGCEKPLGEGWGVRVGNPPTSMSDEEREAIFHDGGCVSAWATRGETTATDHVLNYPPNSVSRRRGIEMAELANVAKTWRR